MNKRKTVTVNYVYNLLFQLLTIITPLVTTPYLSRVLGSYKIGIYGYTFSIVTYFILIGSLGVNMYGQREIAYVQNNREKQSKVFWEINIVKLISFSLSLVAFFLLFCTKGEYKLFYLIYIIDLLANIFNISWYFNGIEDFQKNVIRNAVTKIIAIIAIFVFVKTKNDLWIYILIISVSDFLGYALIWLYVPKYIDFNFKKLNLKKHIKPILLLFIPQVATTIYTVLDKTMIGLIIKDMDEVGFYDQAQKIIRALLLIVTALGSIMNSRIASEFAKNNIKKIKSYLMESIGIVFLISIPMIFGLFAISDKFVPWFFGDGFLPVSKLLKTNGFILLIIGLNTIIGIQYLIQTNQQKKYTIGVSVGALTNIIFNYILLKKIGTIGAVYSSILAEFVILCIELFFARKIIKLKEILILSIKYILSSAVMFLIVYFVGNKLSMSIINTFIEIIIGSVVYSICLLILKDELFLAILDKILVTLKIKKNKSKSEA